MLGTIHSKRIIVGMIPSCYSISLLCAYATLTYFLLCPAITTPTSRWYL